MDSKITKSFFVRNWIWLLPILPTALLGVTLYLHQGPRLTYDSHQFLCAASSFRQYGQLLVCDGKPMVLSAPLFSMMLSLFAEPLNAYALISPLLYWITLCCWVAIISRKGEALPWAPWPILLGVPLFLPFVFLWSEGPFMALFSIGMLGWEKYKASTNRYYLLAMLACFPLAIGFRYAGLFIIVPLLFWEFFEQKKEGKWYVLATFLAVGMVVLLMATRNWWLSHTFSGLRGGNASPFSQVAFDCGRVLANWFVPAWGVGGWSVLLFACVLAMASRVDFKSVFLLATYFLLMVLSASFSDIEYDERLFVPVYPLFVWAVTALFFKEGSRWTFWVGLFWLLYLIVRFVKNICFWLS